MKPWARGCQACPILRPLRKSQRAELHRPFIGRQARVQRVRNRSRVGCGAWVRVFCAADNSFDGQTGCLVKSSEFRLDKATSDRLHGLVGFEEALKRGRFRGEGQETAMTPHVLLDPHGRHAPPPTRPGAGDLEELQTVLYGRLFRRGGVLLCRIESASDLGESAAFRRWFRFPGSF